MIVILPSQYTGGEVHLTHASKSQVVDFSASSLANTAVLAWYTDVLHEVKPITSGYRLALSYNLIHTSPLMALPKAPTDDGPCADLRRVLHNWEKGRYEEPVECNYIAYLLQHKYSEVDFKRGEACLKGEDSERVALVRAAAEGLGFVVLLANMEYHVSENQDYGFYGGYDDYDDYYGGYGGYGGYGRSKRRRGCAFDMPWDDDIDGEVDITLSKIFDLGGSVVLAGNHWESLWINEDCFLPKDALQNESPDDTEESGYTGNVSLSVR